MHAQVRSRQAVTQVAIDGTWSALRLKPLWDDEPPFNAGG
jgi:hypothetical protein